MIALRVRRKNRMVGNTQRNLPPRKRSGTEKKKDLKK